MISRRLEGVRKYQKLRCLSSGDAGVRDVGDVDGHQREISHYGAYLRVTLAFGWCLCSDLKVIGNL